MTQFQSGSIHVSPLIGYIITIGCAIPCAVIFRESQGGEAPLWPVFYIFSSGILLGAYTIFWWRKKPVIKVSEGQMELFIPYLFYSQKICTIPLGKIKDFNIKTYWIEDGGGFGPSTYLSLVLQEGFEFGGDTWRYFEKTHPKHPHYGQEDTVYFNVNYVEGGAKKAEEKLQRITGIGV